MTRIDKASKVQQFIKVKDDIIVQLQHGILSENQSIEQQWQSQLAELQNKFDDLKL